MTPRQKEMARHALGLDQTDSSGNPVTRSYRNRYYIDEGGRGFQEWQEMVSAGFAEVGVVGRSHRFELTKSGALAALNEGESLCPEDFPQ